MEEISRILDSISPTLRETTQKQKQKTHREYKVNKIQFSFHQTGLRGAELERTQWPMFLFGIDLVRQRNLNGTVPAHKV